MKMKKFFALVLSGILALSLLTGCGGGDDVEEEYEDEEIEEVEDDVEEVEEEVESEGEPVSQETLENIAAAIIGTQAMIDTAVENYSDAISEDDMTFLQEATDYLARTNSETDPNTLTEEEAQALYAEIDGMATEVGEVLMASGIQVEGAAAQAETEEAPAEEGDLNALVSEEVWNVLFQNAQAMSQMVQIFDAIGIPAEGEEALNAARELMPAIAAYDQTNLTEGDAVIILDQINQINAALAQFVPEE